jgi:hypothetical protein
MSEGILVTGSEAAGGKSLTRALSVVLLAAGVFLLLQDGWRFVGAALVLLALVALVGGEGVAAARRAARRWVVDTGSGLRWIGGPAEISVEDRQVTAVRLAHRRKYAAGLHKYTARDFDVWIEGRPAPLRMRNRIAVGVSDPLGAMIGRVCDDLKQRAAAGLADGQPLAGDQWSLRPAELTLQRGKSLVSVPFWQIDKVDLFDKKLCIWCKGEDLPAARIDPASCNAPVLHSLLSEWVAHQREIAVLQAGADGPAEPATAPSVGSDLGRVLFQRRKWKMAVYLGFAAALLAGLGLAAGADTWIAGGIFLAAAAAVAFTAWGWSRFILRCHERGIYRRWGTRELSIPYADITMFTYSATRRFVKGGYAGTQFSLKCTAPRGTIAYSATVNSPDQELDNLRDHIAKGIAARMLRYFSEGNAVGWTANMAFLPAGLQFRRAAALGLGRKPPELLPYDQIRGVNIQAGVFYLWNRTEPKPIISQPVSTPNFFPGYYMIWQLLQKLRAGEENSGGER